MSYRKNAPALDEHVTAIGWLCVDWSGIELQLNQFIGTVAVHNWAILPCITANADMSQKIQMALGLGFHYRPSDEAFEKLRAVLNHIDKTLRPERNRFVHGFWIAGEDSTTRMHQRVSFKKPQSRQPLEMQVTHEKAFTADEIWAFVAEINKAAVDLMHISILHYSDVLRYRGSPRISTAPPPQP